MVAKTSPRQGPRDLRANLDAGPTIIESVEPIPPRKERTIKVHLKIRTGVIALTLTGLIVRQENALVTTVEIEIDQLPLPFQI